MKAHIIMNDPLAPPGAVKEWLQHHHYESDITRAYANESFPSMDEFDLLFILGGSVGAYEDDQYNWLKKEKQFICEAIEADKYVIGICLGAQLIAEVLGGSVYKMEKDEIGWTKVYLSSNRDEQSNLLYKVPEEFTVFQYHGDTFELPNTAELIGYGSVCHNQLFKYGERVLGLQFHPEFNDDILENIIKHLGKDLQRKLHYENNKVLQETLIKEELITDANKLLFQLLNNITNKTSNDSY